MRTLIAVNANNKTFTKLHFIDDNKYIGSISVEVDKAFDRLKLWSFEINPKYRNRGYGHKVFKKVARRFKNKKL